MGGARSDEETSDLPLMKSLNNLLQNRATQISYKKLEGREKEPGQDARQKDGQRRGRERTHKATSLASWSSLEDGRRLRFRPEQSNTPSDACKLEMLGKRGDQHSETRERGRGKWGLERSALGELRPPCCDFG